MCSLRGPLLVLGRGCALVFGRGAEVLGRYVCSTRASSFLPFLIKFLEASLEFWFAFELVFPDLDCTTTRNGSFSQGECWGGTWRLSGNCHVSGRTTFRCKRNKGIYYQIGP